MKTFFTFIFLLFAPAALFSFNLNQHHQMVLVITEDWGLSDASVSLWSRKSSQSRWKLKQGEIKAKVGSKGLAWGRGLHPDKKLIGPRKQEEDKKTPCGIFTIGPIVGIGSKKEITPLKMPYIHITESLLAVNDIYSPFYNQIVDTQYIQKNWHSAINLSEHSCLNWGAIIEYNLYPSVPKDGSCTFLLEKKEHLNSSDFSYVAISYDDLIETIYWLRQTDKPIIVLLTKQNYQKFRQAWNLPDIKNG